MSLRKIVFFSGECRILKIEQKARELIKNVTDTREIELLREHIIHNLELHRSHIMNFDVEQLCNIIEHNYFYAYRQNEFPKEHYAITSDQNYYLMNKLLRILRTASTDRLLKVVAYTQTYYIFS
jgi:hypothetical protein